MANKALQWSPTLRDFLYPIRYAHSAAQKTAPLRGSLNLALAINLKI